jgi:hypothetical protein
MRSDGYGREPLVGHFEEFNGPTKEYYLTRNVLELGIRRVLGYERTYPNYTPIRACRQLVTLDELGFPSQRIEDGEGLYWHTIEQARAQARKEQRKEVERLNAMLTALRSLDFSDTPPLDLFSEIKEQTPC